MNPSTAAIETFRSRFGREPDFLVRSPGRVNLIGEHTDYNDGFVLPLAIERAIWIAFRPRDDRTVRLWSTVAGGPAEFDIESLTRGGGWVAYVQGVAHELLLAGHDVQGWEGVITSDIPTGAGLSSSAALELGTARAFASVSGLPWDPVKMAVLSQRAENDWVGMNCGIMDQLICAAGEVDRALLIDCRNLTWSPARIPAGAIIVVLDTSTRRELVGSAYNDRVSSCLEAAATFGVRALRDLDRDTLAGGKHRLDPLVFRRARHVVGENDRTLTMARALNDEDLGQAGNLMQESHTSMREDFEISSPDLDAMVASAMGSPGCYGARMTGGGFGGSCVALVATDHLEEFERQTLDRYRTATGLEGVAIPTRPTAGTSVKDFT